MPEVADLPSDIEALKSLVIERTTVLAERSTRLQAAEALVIAQKLELEKLRFQIAQGCPAQVVLGGGGGRGTCT